MPDTTPGTQDNSTEESWQSRYLGLQRVVAKRDEDLHTRTAELDALRAEHEAAQTELADHRQKVIDASEEETARIQYEQLKERFEPEPAKPIGNNPARDWTDGARGAWSTRERKGTGTGFPI